MILPNELRDRVLRTIANAEAEQPYPYQIVYDIIPRWTAEEKQRVSDPDVAWQIAADEQHVHAHALRGDLGEREEARALEDSLQGIVVARWYNRGAVPMRVDLLQDLERGPLCAIDR